MNFGKFKDAESLLRSYENLEKEFTKKCQELARLRFAKINENEMNTEGGVLPRGREIENPEAVTKNDRVQDASGVNSNISNINESSSDRLVYESGRFAKKSTINAENELSVESGRSEIPSNEMENGAEVKIGGVMGTKEKTNKLNAFLDKVYPPEESKCSKSKIENGETFLGSDLEEAGAEKSSPFCGILESARSVLEGSALPENNLGEEELLRENLSFEKNGSGGLSEHKSQNETFNENESFGGRNA